MSRSPYASDLVDVTMEYRGTSASGLAYKMADADGKIVWLPKAPCELDPPEPDLWTVCTVTMPANLAREKGLV